MVFLCLFINKAAVPGPKNRVCRNSEAVQDGGHGEHLHVCGRPHGGPCVADEGRAGGRHRGAAQAVPGPAGRPREGHQVSAGEAWPGTARQAAPLLGWPLLAVASVKDSPGHVFRWVVWATLKLAQPCTAADSVHAAHTRLGHTPPAGRGARCTGLVGL